MKLQQMFKRFLAVAAATSMVVAGTFTANAPAKEQSIDYYSLANYSEGTYWSNWQMKGMGLDNFQNSFKNKTNLPEIVVAVLDTGCKTDDPGFAGRILTDRAISVTNASSVYESSGHGTNTIRGLIDASPSNVKVLPVRITSTENTTRIDDIVNAINASVNAGVDVIQCCAGYDMGKTNTMSASFLEALKNADAKGVIVCVASGNYGTDSDYSCPSASPNCISVAAADNGMTLTYRSNYNATITSYSHNDGTSYATPNVSAVAAMLKTMDRSITRQQMVNIISTMAIDIGAKGKDDIYGNGFLYMGDFIQNNDIHCLHNYTRQEISDATCSKAGQIRFTCTKCGTSFTRTEDPRHQYMVTRTSGSCVEDGTFHIECALCGDVKTDKLLSTATGHDYQTYTSTSGKGKNKVTTTVTKCSKCGATKCTSHQYTKTIVSTGDCTHEGLAKYTCKNCGESYTEATAKGTHNYTKETITEATCTTPGQVKYTCSGCGDSYTETVSGSHNYVKTTISAATCTQTGKYEYKCSKCGDSYTETIPATGSHSYTKTIVKAATCTTAGTEKYTCTKCGDSYEKEIAATGHTAGKGKNKSTCTKCGAKIK